VIGKKETQQLTKDNMMFNKDKRKGLALFEYADKLLSELTDEEIDRVRRYLNYKFEKRRKVNRRNIYDF
jgi:hypothetical protein|tara:strand:- start:155 stop:361 length:207 start_codon:yes stop_codon:yes gene_type:complete